MAAQDRNVIIDPTTGHRIDPLTKIDIDQAITDGDNVALMKIEVAQYEAMLAEEPENWYLKHSLKAARKSLARFEDRAAAIADLTATVRRSQKI